MRYDPVYNILVRDANDDKEILEDGKSLRVRMTAMDSTQLAIARGNSATVEDSDVTLISRQEMQDFDKAELSARWKGGLQDGDRVRIGDKNLVVSGRNPTNGKVVLSDASTADAETVRQEAYVAYDRDIQNSWMQSRDAVAGGACTTAGRESGTWREREKDGRLVCVPSGKPNEWDIAGPLSDAERVQVRDQAYAEYDRAIGEAWRK
jgi:hypothetical protein